MKVKMSGLGELGLGRVGGLRVRVDQNPFFSCRFSRFYPASIKILSSRYSNLTLTLTLTLALALTLTLRVRVRVTLTG